MQRTAARWSLWLLVAVSGCSTITNTMTKSIGITGIDASDTELRIKCSVPKEQVKLIELLPYQQYDSGQDQTVAWQGSSKSRIVIDRFQDQKDRIYHKFLLIDSTTSQPLGNPRYVTDFSGATRRDTALPRPKCIKGLTCIVNIDDAIELGVKHVNENIFIQDLLDLGNPNPQAVWEFEGEKIPLNMEGIRRHDQRVQRFTQAGIGVMAILLNQMPLERQPNNPLLDQDSDIENSKHHLGAFNVTTEEGLKYYEAALEFLAERYTRPDGKYGLINAIIIGNELQQHWVWYNMGDAPQEKVVREYLIAMRLAWLAFQKYHPDLRVYISMDYHWNRMGFKKNPLRELRGDAFLEAFAQEAKREGDFPWNVAFHPYPEDLLQPQFWRDKHPTDNFDTPIITFKNIEVLPRFLKQECFLYRGRVRDIALTEQGFHSTDKPDGELNQAAAYAYAYWKISHIPEISCFILHRHVDHRGEGGLKVGLWTNDPDAASLEAPLKKKMIWEVFKHAGTSQQEKYFQFAKPIVGIKEWSDPPTNTEPLPREPKK